jgi:outer membrane immunogenic protein
MTRKLLLTSVSFAALIAGPAMAADQTPRPLPPPLLPVWSWTGVYLGIDGGYSFGREELSLASTFTPTPGTIIPFSSTSPFVVAPNGGFVGGQIGYNLQSGSTVFGVEVDGQWADQRDTTCSFDCQTASGLPNGFQRTVRNEVNWFATARGRLGWANDNYLLYLTGGGALAGIGETDTVFFSAPGLTVPPVVATFRTTRLGWTLGGGMEVRLAGNWTAKLEYLHIDLGNMTTDPLLYTLPGDVAPRAFTTVTTSMRDEIVRVGVNYKFDYAAAPAVYK